MGCVPTISCVCQQLLDAGSSHIAGSCIQGYWQATCHTAGPLSLLYTMYVDRAHVDTLISMSASTAMFHQAVMVSVLSR